MAPQGPRTVAFRERIGSPVVGDAPKILLLGSGEIGREFTLEAMRLGAEVVAVDRYAHAPAMQVAHRSHVLSMTDGAALRALVERERPDLIVPEIEQIDTLELQRLEADGWVVIPNAAATRATMHRERIRRLAAEEAKVPTSRFGFADSAEEASEVARTIGFPLMVKAMTSSSGHGMTIVRSAEELRAAYEAASTGGRVPDRRVVLEEFVRFDAEVTVLVVRHYDRSGRPAITVLEPIAHYRPGTVYHESWQPSGLPLSVLERLGHIARAVTERLGGFGVFGVECFVRGGEVLFSEVSPRPHDTGLVTLGSQWNTQFALHARAVLGLPYEGPEPVTTAAAHVILSQGAGLAPTFGGLPEALGQRGVRLYLFGKPEAYPDRRLGVAVARGPDTDTARHFAATAAHAVEAALRFNVSKRDAPPLH
jgi:phosphoribosylglycinamide formyltransferase 2